MTKSDSAGNRPDVTVYNTFGWIRIASINLIIQSYQKPLTLCFAGIAMRQNVTYICQMFQQITMIRPTHLCSRGNQPSRKIDGLPAVGHFKNLLFRYLLNSFAQMAMYSAIRNH